MRCLKYHINNGWEYGEFSSKEKIGYVPNNEIINLLILEISVNNYPAEGYKVINDPTFLFDCTLYNNNIIRNENIRFCVWNELPLEIKNRQRVITTNIFSSGILSEAGVSFFSLNGSENKFTIKAPKNVQNEKIYVAIYYYNNYNIEIGIDNNSFNGIEITEEEISYKVCYELDGELIEHDSKVLYSELDSIVEEIFPSCLYDVEEIKTKKTIKDEEFYYILYPKITPKKNSIQIEYYQGTNQPPTIIFTEINTQHIFYSKSKKSEWNINDDTSSKEGEILILQIKKDLISVQTMTMSDNESKKLQDQNKKTLLAIKNLIKIVETPISPEASSSSGAITLSYTENGTTIPNTIDITVSDEGFFYFPANYNGEIVEYYKTSKGEGENETDIKYYSPYQAYNIKDFDLSKEKEITITGVLPLTLLDQQQGSTKWPYFKEIAENNLKPIDIQERGYNANVE